MKIKHHTTYMVRNVFSISRLYFLATLNGCLGSWDIISWLGQYLIVGRYSVLVWKKMNVVFQWYMTTLQLIWHATSCHSGDLERTWHSQWKWEWQVAKFCVVWRDTISLHLWTNCGKRHKFSTNLTIWIIWIVWLDRFQSCDWIMFNQGSNTKTF